MELARQRRNFILLEVGQACSQFGNGVFMLAYSWYVLSRPDGSREYALLMLLGAVPGLLLAPVFGIIVDRLPKRTILVAIDATRSVSFFILWRMLKAGEIGFAGLAAFSFLNGMLFFAFDPAIKSSFPLIFGKERLEKANSIDSAVSSFAGLSSMFIGGLLLASFGVRQCFIIKSVTYLVSASCSCFLLIPRPEQKGKMSLKTARSDLLSTLSFIRADPQLGFMMVLGLLLTAFIYPTGNVLFPVLLKKILAFEPMAYSIIQGGYPLGIIIGAAACMRIKTADGKIFNLVFACGLLMSLVILAWGLLARFVPVPTGANAAILFVSVAIMGVLTVIMMIKTNTYFQRATPRQLLGKVISFYQMIGSAIVPVGYVVYGSLLAAMDPVPVLFVVCLAVPLLSTAVLLRKRAASARNRP